MAKAELFTSPMARKKAVPCHYSPNSYRVISQQAESIDYSGYHKSSDAPYVNLLGQPADLLSVPIDEHRHNRPNPRGVGFLKDDVRLLMGPICDVHTSTVEKEQHQWWPSRTSDDPLKQPDHTLDTTFRHDFQYNGSDVSGNSRHSSNPNTTPAHGCVPVNFLGDKSGKKRVYKEGISYEHQYNSRLDPQYPIRGKRHGSFVWDRFSDVEVAKMLHHYGYISDKLSQSDNIYSREPKQGSKSGSATQATNPITSKPSVQARSKQGSKPGSPTGDKQTTFQTVNSQQQPAEDGNKMPPVII